MKGKRISVVIGMLVITTLVASPVLSDEVKEVKNFKRADKIDEVEKVLAIADSNLTKVKDQTYVAYLEVIRDGKVSKTLRFEVKLKGLKQKLVKFTAPGDVRGMAVLTTSDGLMYVYMPSYKRVRRIAAHVRNQGFMGTDISPEEMASASLSEGWNGKILEETERLWKVELTPKPGTETEYAKMIVTVLKEHQGVETVESYDKSGKLIKSQIRTEWKSFGPVHLPTLFEFKDHRTGTKTLMRFEDCLVNKGLSDSIFTTRSLMRGGD